MSTIAGRPKHGAVSQPTWGDLLVVPLVQQLRRLAASVAAHRVSLAVLLPVLALTSTVRFWNFANTPGAWNDDEGTYVAQAWAVLFKHKLADYTYWYDHPPFGWIQIAAWAGLTNGFGRHVDTIQIGRELVAIYTVIAAVLIFALCRRLGMNRVFSALAVALFMVSPLGMTYGRMVFLDSLMVPWVFGALLAATYAGKSSTWAYLSGMLLASAVLTKETSFFFVPIALWIVWRVSDQRLKFKNTVKAGFATFLIGLSYVLLAILKGELFAGPGHVSLQYSIMWQLTLRQGGGSIFDPSSLTFDTAQSWFNADPVLLTAGVLMTAVLVLRRSMWPIAVLALMHMVMLLRTGYTPIPYVVILIPLAAITIAGGLDTLWQRVGSAWWATWGFKTLSGIVAAAFVVAAAVVWTPQITSQWSNTNLNYERDAVSWIVKNAPASEHKVIVMDHNIRPDLLNRGYDPVDIDWLYKVDADPAILKRYIPKWGNESDAWQRIDYIVIPRFGPALLKTVPTVYEAIQHSKVVASFNGTGNGQYVVYKIIKPKKGSESQ